jgi:predicted small metal-binding protein
MKIVKCRDLGLNCDFMAAGSDKEEVEKTIFDHIEKEHKAELDKMSEDDKKYLKHRVSTLLGRGCGCGAL